MENEKKFCPFKWQIVTGYRNGNRKVQSRFKDVKEKKAR